MKHDKRNWEEFLKDLVNEAKSKQDYLKLLHKILMVLHHIPNQLIQITEYNSITFHELISEIELTIEKWEDEPHTKLEQII